MANAEAPETPLYIFSDSPRNIEASKAVEEVRTYISGIAGFKSLSIIERSHNFGLAGSIIDGVTRVCQQHGRVIVLEDDLVTSRYFLRYMNDGLTLYENDRCVISIHGYVYPVKADLPETFFLMGADCWGWATWKRGWDMFVSDGNQLLDALKKKNLTRRFDYDGAYPHTKMLKEQIKGKNDSWAIRWYASAYVKGMLTLYPKSSLVQNIGFDNSGTHCGTNDSMSVELAQLPIHVDRIPVMENTEARKKIVMFLYLTRITSLFRRFAKFFQKNLIRQA